MLFRSSVAVVVLSVTDLVGGVCVRTALWDRSVDAARDTDLARAASADLVGDTLVDLAIAVVVDPVTNFRALACEGVTGCGDSIHTGRNLLLTGPGATGNELSGIVRQPVTVVVDPVADLGCGLSRGACAGRSVGTQRGGRRTGAFSTGLHAFIDDPVAVVVVSVTNLRVTRLGNADLAHAIDACRQGDLTLSDAAVEGTQVFVDRAITVVVDIVADLGLRRILGTGVWRPVQTGRHGLGAGANAAAQRPQTLVDIAVAVVVLAIAELDVAEACACPGIAAFINTAPATGPATAVVTTTLAATVRDALTAPFHTVQAGTALTTEAPTPIRSATLSGAVRLAYASS